MSMINYTELWQTVTVCILVYSICMKSGETENYAAVIGFQKTTQNFLFDSAFILRGLEAKLLIIITLTLPVMVSRCLGCFKSSVSVGYCCIHYNNDYCCQSSLIQLLANRCAYSTRPRRCSGWITLFIELSYVVTVWSNIYMLPLKTVTVTEVKRNALRVPVCFNFAAFTDGVVKKWSTDFTLLAFCAAFYSCVCSFQRSFFSFAGCLPIMRYNTWVTFSYFLK